MGGVGVVANAELLQKLMEGIVAQLANSLNLRPQGGLPGDTEPNPKQLNAGIPKYAKYVKGIVANKSRLMEYETVALTEECNSRIQNRLPKKLKDPSSFTKHALGSPKPTSVILQLADRSIARPECVVEDVLVQVGSLIFPVDFVVLKFKHDLEVPFILVRPFLATGRALIDVAVG
ncbi:hypothetical protein KY285_010661 [Solanum tuberosum]|nr:hypothetical protein KY285_010661 [Solanum tuberosum]